MPSKEYLCRQCGHDFRQILFRGDGEQHPVCPKCTAENVEAAIGPAGIFKGISSFSTLAKDSN